MNNQFVWLGDQGSLDAYVSMLRTCFETYGSLSGSPAMMGTNDSEDDQNPVSYDIVGNLAVIGVKGSTVTMGNWMTRWYGIASYSDIRDRFIQAAEDKAAGTVKGVLYRVNSSGGQANGVSTTSKFIRNFNNTVMPVVGFSDIEALSAGYWTIASSAKVITEAEASLGSIGALMVHMDYSEQLKQNGVKVTVFRSAPFKALVTPYEKLSAEATAEINQELAFWHDLFATGISDMRGIDLSKVKSTLANGKTYRAPQAISIGMSDQILSFEETVARLNTGLAK